MIIRRATIHDAQGLIALAGELAIHGENDSTIEVSCEQLIHDMESYDWLHIWVAEVDAVVVGMIFCSYAYSTRKGKTLYIDDFVVSKSMRGQGIGRKLFAEMLNFCKKDEIQRLWRQTGNDNEASQKFYEKYSPEKSTRMVDLKIHRKHIEVLAKMLN